jgi:tight adherence protein B
MPSMPIIMIACAAVLVIAMIALAFSGPSTAKAQTRRINALRDRHSNSTGAIVEAQMRRIQAVRNTRMDNLAAQFLPKPAVLKKRLDMTGKTWTPGKYLGACLIIGVIVLALLLIKGAPILMSLFVSFFLGLMIPHIVVGFTIKSRVAKFTKNFPDAIELLVRGLRSGLPITETLGVVAAEIPGPVGVEFRSVSDKMKIGRTMDTALQETADRLGTPEFQFFVITLQIQRETGGNLAETLSNLADVLRKRMQMKLKIKAMSSESKASAYIIGALPFIVFFMILQINYAYMASFFSDPRLIVTGLGGMVWMGIGGFIMRQMINFEI